MKVLLTGDSGRLGVAAREALTAAGHSVVGFDLARGDDILDAAAVLEAARGTDAVVHLAGLADDRSGSPDAVMQVNVCGTWNVLLAAAEAGCSRVVYSSSGKALGMLERDPGSLPLDDAAPGMPSTPYGLSKWLSEQMCEAWSRKTGIPTLCLRPVLVLDEEGWERFAAFDELPPARGSAWHLGVFVDVDDVAAAIALAVGVPDPPLHSRMLLCADEVAAERPAAEIAREWIPAVPWRDGAQPADDSRGALVDCSVARDVLGWRPIRGWDHRLRVRAAR